MSKYVDIKTPNARQPKSIFVDIDGNDEVMEPDLLLSDDEITERTIKNIAPSKNSLEVKVDMGEIADDEVQPESESTVKQDGKTVEKKASRAQKRIKGLLEKDRENARLLAEKDAQIDKLMKLAETGTKSTKENLKSTLEQQVTQLTQALTKAMQDGETERVVDIQDHLINAKSDLRDLMKELSEMAAKPVPERQQQQQPTAPHIPELALDWIEEYPQFKTDQIFHNMARMINDQLLMEGFNPESEDFYEELTDRLAPRFPEVFGMSDEKVVSSKRDGVKYSKTPDSSDEATENTSTRSKRQQPQTVSQASRTPPNSAQKARKANTVELTPEHLAQAEKWGWSVEQMARRVAHIEKNRRTDGYAPIMIERNKK